VTIPLAQHKQDKGAHQAPFSFSGPRYNAVFLLDQ
jgi:hypothetical protein